MSETTEDLSRLRGSIEEIGRIVEARLAEDRVREQAFEKLYAELKDYKEGFVREAERPLLLDLCLLYDSMSFFHQRLSEAGAGSEALADAFQLLVDELLEVLYRRDVVPMDPADVFDPTQHRAAQLQAASGPEQDNRIAQTLKRGFLRFEKPLRPEEVVVYRWRGAAK